MEQVDVRDQTESFEDVRASSELMLEVRDSTRSATSDPPLETREGTSSVVSSSANDASRKGGASMKLFGTAWRPDDI